MALRHVIQNANSPLHTLDRVQITLYLPQRVAEQEYSLRAVGISPMKATPLWTYQEAFDPELEEEKGYSVADAAHHIALVTVQDRPRTLKNLEFALRGGIAWEQGQMF